MSVTMDNNNMSKILRYIMHSRWCHLLTLFLIVFVVYGPSIHAPFVWDDEEMVVANPIIRSLDNISVAFKSSAFGDASASKSFYRPLQIMSYSLDYALWSLNPFGYRLTNILIHCFTMLGLFMIMSRFKWHPLLVFLMTAIWCVHPIGIEAVTYISGRGDALFMCFGVWSIYCLIAGNHFGYWVMAILLYGLTLLSKENGISLPLLMILLALSPFKIDHVRSWRWPISVMGLMMGAMTGIRLMGVTQQTTVTLSWIAQAELIERLATVPYMVITYLRLFVFPTQLHMEYHYVATHLWNTYSFWLCGIVIGLVWIYKHANKSTRSLLVLGILWSIIALGPVWNVALPLASTVREHWFLLPMIGLLFFGGEWIHRLSDKNKRMAMIILFIWGMGLAAVTLDRNKDWMSPLKLYSNDVKLEPRSVLLHNNLGVYYFRKGQYVLAKKNFENAILQSPNKRYGVALNNLGVIYEIENNMVLAQRFYIDSIEANYYYKAYINLIRLYVKNKDHNQAIKLIKNARERYPSNRDLLLLEQYVIKQLQK